MLLSFGWGAVGAAQAEPLVLAAVRNPFCLPILVAEVKGFFKAEGADVRILECPVGQQCLQRVFDGSAQLATVSELPVMHHSFERADYAIAATFVTSNQNIQLVGRRSANAFTAGELEGKRVGVLAHSSAHYYLNAYLLFHGVDPARVQMVYLKPDTLASAIAQGEVDALAAFRHQASAAMLALGPDGILLGAPPIYTETFNLVAYRDTLTQRHGDIVKVLRALERAQRFIHEQPKAAKEILQAGVNLNQESADSVLQRYTYRLNLDQSLISTLEGEARWAVREGKVPAGRKVPNYLDYVDERALRAAVPAAFRK
ncbi:MAG: ABC transporter substrate-binding protein [Pseudomonadota bacterium]